MGRPVAAHHIWNAGAVRPHTDESNTALARVRRLRHELGVGAPLFSERTSKHTTRREFTIPTVAQRCCRIVVDTASVPPLVEERFRRPRAFDAHPDTVCPTPPVGTLPTGVRAVDPVSAGPVDMFDDPAAHRAVVFRNHLAAHRSLCWVESYPCHGVIVTVGCDGVSGVP